MARDQEATRAKHCLGKAPLLARLNGTQRLLEDIHARLAESTASTLDLGSAGEWLLDNFHVVEEHIGEIRLTLPRGYYRELPELSRGTLAGYPRIYEVATTLISHSEGRIDLENVALFVHAFQEVSPLTIGELWAIPAMLRLGLIENVRRMALRTMHRLDEADKADRRIARIRADTESGALRTALGRMVDVPWSVASVFVGRFLRQLHQEQDDSPMRRSLESWMMEQGLSVDDLDARSTQRLALTEVMMANSITSLRTIARLDWRLFVERESAIEAILREDPSAFYARMTFDTRNSYRTVIERISRRSGVSEEIVARRAIRLAGEAAAIPDGHDARRDHVGFYLLDDGRVKLEAETGYRPPPGEGVHRWIRRHGSVVFFGGLTAATAAVLAGTLGLGGLWSPAGVGEWIVATVVVLLSFIPATEIGVRILNELVTTFMPPRPLPRLDFYAEGEIPIEFRSVVVIPTLFGSVAAVHEALENLEVQFLANRERYLHFAVLGDFTDSATENRDGDAAIVEAAETGVRALNSTYAAGAQDAFYYFHRPRRWNPQEDVWMGWERKRGKLTEFNRFLRGETGAFSVIVGDVTPLPGVRFVITLDADTNLPPDAAPLLVGSLAHPLNRPEYDAALGRVVRGYGILQPRVGVSLPSANGSRFAAIHSGHPGVDPYTTAVSDVYQDLFSEGSFTGKGIYDVDAFEEATRGRFAENTLLSHDLIEGNFARAGLATDVVVYDDYPARYLSSTSRKHRWIRGDWQLLPWLSRRMPGSDGPEPNRLSLVSLWKIIDNLRRSLVEIALMALLVAGWTFLPGSPLRWTTVVLGLIAAPWVVTLLVALFRPPFDRSWRAYYDAVGRDAVTSIKQATLAVTFLAHQAVISADAVARTLWRVFVSRRSLLQWQTASKTERTATGSAMEIWQAMWPVTVLVLLILGFTAVLESSVRGGPIEPPPGSLSPWWHWALAVLPLSVLWLFSPTAAHSLGRSGRVPETALSAAGRSRALRYALLHWRYFDRFVNESTHWLAPDNYQEDPAPLVAMRTSPTNIGLQLLATTSAYDLGFVSAPEMIDRLEQAFVSMDSMRRFRGHFYNWYDLHDLRVLEPAYVSTVDSGNLAGHLVALRQACLAIPDEPLFDGRIQRVLGLALTMALERLGDRQVHGAADLVKQARSVLNGPISGRDLETIETRVRRAVLLLRQAGHDAGSQTTEWLEWSQRRIEAALLEGLDEPSAFRGSGQDSPTLRGRAATSTAASELVARLESLAHQAYLFALEMDFRLLFDDNRKLFSIGYNENGHALDGSYYDLLASEARLTSFLAVAKNDVPVGHWFSLGRSLTHSSGETALVSWSGSMFEYLMPTLVMRWFDSTLLSQTYRGTVRRQIAYGQASGVPWGMSESAYNLRDRHLTYQYRAFGVPDLALKRGLGRDLVVAPYASELAAMLEPQRALENLNRLERQGALGRFGFYDAVDYTRPDPGKPFAIVRTYMAHHVGMGLVALTNALRGRIWQHRFHTDPLVRAAELLLYEMIPRRLVLQVPQKSRAGEALPDPEVESPFVRQVQTPDTPDPRVALLGRLPYTIMVTGGGGGYSRYENLAVTRWRPDGTTDDTGQFCYVKDLYNGHTWSSAHQPTCTPADEYRAQLATDRVTFRRVDGELETYTEITVVPEDSAEVRRVTVTNRSERLREVELTSYGEIVLGSAAADRVHPAFSKLFVETEWHPSCSTVTATRRPRSSDETPLWCVHVVDSGRSAVESVSCETDRARFIGRGRSSRRPVALERDGALSCTTGAVLDPIFALRIRLRLEPGQTACAAFTTLVATSRERALELAGRYHDPHTSQRALDLAWASTQVELRELGVTPTEAGVFQDLAGRLFFPSDSLGAPRAERRLNHGSQSLLWSFGVSGDWPILLATIRDSDGLPTLRQLLSAHRYWRRRGMMVDLVIVNAHPPTYLQQLNDSIVAMLYALHASDEIDRPGGVFIRKIDRLGAEALLMLRASAPVHVDCDGRALGHILEDAVRSESPVREKPVRARARRRRQGAALPARTNESPNEGATGTESPRVEGEPGRPGDGDPSAPANGFGSLLPGGSYQVMVSADRVPPAPWANVVANPLGGFITSERGAGATWAESSYFFRLTPWHNDPVTDEPGEAIYLRDEETLALWTATPAPRGGTAEFTVVHGAGFTTYEHEAHGISTHLTMAMAPHHAVKLSLVRLTNKDSNARRLAITGFVSWTLGVLREQTRHQVHTFAHPELGAMFARNYFDPLFAGHVAFFALSEPLSSFSDDRRGFIGRNGSLADPISLRSPALDMADGTGIDPCAALQCTIVLEPGETKELVVLLGAAPGEDEAVRLVREYRDPRTASEAVALSRESWSKRLSVITVHTPEPTFDTMINHWTLYQALSCRMWARSATYQAGGAYGFRDQLQDVLALVYAEPALAREHILRAAARQFVEGDVQHWWHAHNGRGVRTRFSDDLVWLPYVVDQYVKVTGDRTVLDSYVPFLSMRRLEPHEHEVYDLPQVTDEHASVYEHGRRALDRACTVGSHGLPLIGIGDWNDGLNRVGVEGKGESVWLAWFLAATLRSFAEHAAARGDSSVAATFRVRADAYVRAIETHGWDGAWYRRAYFDDGTPLGSAESTECRIDSIAQSWSVISGAGDPKRAEQAMRSFEEHLVLDVPRLLPLLAPPFDHGPLDPGYIKGYVPGVRENGAQYTHAALWSVLATALQGRGDRAFELFQMTNPLTRSRTAEEVDTYRVEPYVVAADVYTASGQLARGGWTWYTGAAGWMYRVGLEAMLGFRKRGNTLFIEPCVPATWPEYSIEYRFGASVYAIRVERPAELKGLTAAISVDGIDIPGPGIPLVNDGQDHQVLVQPGRSTDAGPGPVTPAPDHSIAVFGP